MTEVRIRRRMAWVDLQRRVNRQPFAARNVRQLEPVGGSLSVVVPSWRGELVFGIAGANLPADAHSNRARKPNLSGFGLERPGRRWSHHWHDAWAGAVNHWPGMSHHVCGGRDVLAPVHDLLAVELTAYTDHENRAECQKIESHQFASRPECAVIQPAGSPLPDITRLNVKRELQLSAPDLRS